ncbi:DUF2306 domain-containing protein [Puniceicoccaceae bacterium K14]|nr:DUF2306 domain-containing protein [Puniceicoccaceae bacterium K14]
MLRLKKSEWMIIGGLLFLSLVPCVGGVIRLIELHGGPELMPHNPRVRSAPTPVIIHLLGSIPYCVIGILQFLPTVRNAYPVWHRRSGRILIVLGLLSAVSGLWMTHFYGFPEELQGPLLYWVRIFVGTGMIVSIALGLSAVLKKKISEHKKWMLRAYALGQGAGTQVFVALPWILTVGEPSGLTRDILMTLAWVINLFVVQLSIRRSRKADLPTNKRLHQKTLVY